MTASTAAKCPPATTISSEMVQAVSYEEEFNEDISNFLSAQNISQLGFDYHVASIMGPQSSGKSTLLNLLFRTKFRTMDESSGRYQVTQGVWMGRDSDAGILVMDLEGTDSRERGEDATTFERKSALFALALSEVLIVNIWAQDVGRYNAANMSLLKTIMELDLRLFFGGTGAEAAPVLADDTYGKQRMHKTRLLFVLRDHVSSPFETLCKTLRADVDNIWNTISKPDAAIGTPITDYFDLDFFALPHKVLMAEQFSLKGAELRRRFQEGEIFQDEYRRGVAADGFSEYAKSVWETIRANRDLDIPSQKEMLAHVRCEQIAKDSLAKMAITLSPLKEKLFPGDGKMPEIIPGLFVLLVEGCNDAIDAYGEAAFRYSKTVADAKAADLRTRIGTDCKSLFDAQVGLAFDKALGAFRATVGGPSYLTKSASPWQNWGQVSQSALESALMSFDEACSTAALTKSTTAEREGHPLESSVSSAANTRKRLVDTLDVELERATMDVTAAARNHCAETFHDAFKAPLLSVLDTASENVWERVSEVSSVAWEATAKEAGSVYGERGLGFDDGKLEEAIQDKMKVECYESALRDIKDAIGTPSNFLMRMTKRFDDAFRFDERGVPRHFGTNEDIEALFVDAREKGEELVDLLGEVKLEGPLTEVREKLRGVDAEVSRVVILEAHAKVDLREKLKRQAGAVFMEAKRAQEASKVTTKVPIWVFILVLILGWNEFMAVVRSPLLLLLAVLVLPVVYVGYALDAPTLLYPAVRATVNPLLEQAKEMLEQATASETTTAPTVVATESVASANVSASSTHDEKKS